MKQQYFTNTIISKFIKYLLAYSPLPVYPTISTDDLIIEGCTYVYKYLIIKCTKTGLFKGIKHNQSVVDHLYVNEYLQTTDNDRVLEHYGYLTKNGKEQEDWHFWGEGYSKYNGKNISEKSYEVREDGTPGIGGLTVTDDIVKYDKMPAATFEFVDYYNFGHDYLNITNRFISNYSYYDSETHRRLGEYLRCLRDIYDLDLMGLYNCFNYNFVDNLSLKVDRAGTGVVQSSNEKTKLMLVPIKFNKTYTIAMDCSFPVLLRSVIYDKTLLKDSNGRLLIDRLQETTMQINGMTFGSPIEYSITNEYKELQNFEKNLYLAIQIPSNLQSSIVILEGRYSNSTGRRTVNVENLNSMPTYQVSELFRSNLSLLEKNDGKQYPFADKLIAYLLRYTIDTREYIDDNVERIENAIKYDPNTVEDFQKGIWDLDLRYVLFRNYLNIKNKDFISKLDITGFVDKDIENAAIKGWIDYAKFGTNTN